jgi:hypothetical protein
MIQIIVKKSNSPRLFDRMPLPKSGQRNSGMASRLVKNMIVQRSGFGLFQSTGGLNKYQTSPFVRKVSKIS